MTDNITGKRILFVCQRFFGYEQKIKETLLELGASDVYWQDVKWFRGNIKGKKTWRTLLFYLRAPMARTKWTRKIYKAIEDKEFDVLLCIENTPFKKWYIQKLKRKNPAMKTILFLWDTQDVQKSFMDYFYLFDKIYSFDRDECAKYGFEYFPDFYIEDSRYTTKGGRKYDLAFVSKCQPFSTEFRAALLAKIDDFCIEKGLDTFFHLKYIPKGKPHHHLVRKWFSEQHRLRKYHTMLEAFSNRKWLKDYDLPLNAVQDAYNNATAILDLSYPDRQGMTLNCIASIAKGKKLITTNYKIKEEPFYDANNILVIDGENPVIDPDFFRKPAIKIDMTYLRLDNWLKHIINAN